MGAGTSPISRLAKVSLPEPWHAFLADVDEALQQEVSLHCLGGFVLAALYDLLGQPETDYISINPAGVQDELFRIGGLGSPYLPYPPLSAVSAAVIP